MRAGGPAAAACSDSQTLAAFGATCVDHGTATAGLHADQKTVGTGAAGFGRLVSAFHDNSLALRIRGLDTRPHALRQGDCLFGAKPAIIANFQSPGKSCLTLALSGRRYPSGNTMIKMAGLWFMMCGRAAFRPVDKLLIIQCATPRKRKNIHIKRTRHARGTAPRFRPP